ncbi:hypothetical protein BDL97_09G042800 [Sphagnum fallax]|nr:hypothetical protein BDL97_09G042800 [Sphagnum fallax]
MATVQALLGSDFPNAAAEEEERGIINGQSSDADLIGHGRVEEEDLQKLKAMDFISINSKCPLASVQETYVFEGSNKVVDDLAASKPPRSQLQLPRMERYALDKVPSPIKVRAEGNAKGASATDLSPPSSPKRKRETDHKQDLMDVAFTAVLPAKIFDLPRSQSTSNFRLML